MLGFCAAMFTLWAFGDACLPFGNGSSLAALGFCLLLLLRKFSRRSALEQRIFFAGVITCALVAIDLPVKLMLLAHRSTFAQLTMSDDEAERCFWEGCPRRVGLYTVDEVLTDHNGGLYLRTEVTGDLLGPDIWSTGFARHANPHQTPFGHHSLRWHHILGDWYAFEVSNCGS